MALGGGGAIIDLFAPIRALKGLPEGFVGIVADSSHFDCSLVALLSIGTAPSSPSAVLPLIFNSKRSSGVSILDNLLHSLLLTVWLLP